jgi:hypothetical protein
MVNANSINCWSSKTRRLSFVAYAAVLSAALGSSFAGPVLNDDFYASDGSGPKTWTVLTRGGKLSREMSSAGDSVAVQQSYPPITPDQVTTPVRGTSSIASSLPVTSNLTAIDLNSATLSLTPGTYSVTSSEFDHATLTLTGTGYFALNITTYLPVNSGQVGPGGEATGRNLIINYTGMNQVVISGADGPGESLLRGILVALNAKVSLSPGLIASVAEPQKAPSPPPLGFGPRAVPDFGSTITLSCLACLALALFSSFLNSRRLSR